MSPIIEALAFTGSLVRFLIAISLSISAFISFKVNALDIACQPESEEKIFMLQDKYRDEVFIQTEEENGRITVSLSFPDNIEGLQINTIGFTVGNKDNPLIIAPLQYKILMASGHSAFFIDKSFFEDLYVYLAYGYCPVTLNYKVVRES